VTIGAAGTAGSGDVAAGSAGGLGAVFFEY
jgi:hypothetical protein